MEKNFGFIRKALTYLGLAGAVLIGTAYPSMAQEPGDMFPAAVICDSVDDMKTLLTYLDDGQQDKAVARLRDDESFKCYLMAFSNVPFFPTVIVEKLETYKGADIFKAKLVDPNTMAPLEDIYTYKRVPATAS